MSDPQALQIIDVDPINLTASLDAGGNLVLSYGSENLADYDDAIDVLNDDLPVTINIGDFVDGATTWEMSASHLVNNSTVAWTQTATGCAYTWSATGGYVDVDVEAQAGTETKSEPLVIRVRPRTEQ